MKKLGLAGIVIAAMLFSSLPAGAQTTRLSPHETISTVIGGRGGSRVTITYGRPYSKNPKTGEIRKIWGGLVPFGKVWRAGSDEATLMAIQVPMVIGDTTLPAGAYTLFMVPNEDGPSKLVINKKVGQWGIPYNEKNEAANELARIDLPKDAVPDARVDEWTMSVVADPATGGGIIKMVWENTAFAMPFTLKK
jgi:hypothetical protein